MAHIAIYPTTVNITIYRMIVQIAICSTIVQIALYRMIVQIKLKLLWKYPVIIRDQMEYLNTLIIRDIFKFVAIQFAQ